MPLFPPPNPVPWLLESGGADAATAVVLAANTTYLTAIAVPANCIITAMRYRATTASGNLDLGIYDANGNLLGHTGVTAVVGGNPQTVNLTSPLTLGPGRYYLAFWIDNATATIFRIASNNEMTSNVAQSVGTNAGGLASTFAGMGGINGTNTAITRMLMSAIVQGGLP